MYLQRQCQRKKNKSHLHFHLQVSKEERGGKHFYMVDVQVQTLLEVLNDCRLSRVPS